MRFTTVGARTTRSCRYCTKRLLYAVSAIKHTYFNKNRTLRHHYDRFSPPQPGTLVVLLRDTAETGCLQLDAADPLASRREQSLQIPSLVSAGSSTLITYQFPAQRDSVLLASLNYIELYKTEIPVPFLTDPFTATFLHTNLPSSVCGLRIFRITRISNRVLRVIKRAYQRSHFFPLRETTTPPLLSLDNCSRLL